VTSASRRRPAEILTELEVLALIRACSASAPSGVRNRALIAVLWRAGLRVGEALALELRDVDLAPGTVRVRHGKGDRSRTVGVDEQTAALLARWIDRRRQLRSTAQQGLWWPGDQLSQVHRQGEAGGGRPMHLQPLDQGSGRTLLPVARQ